MRAGGKEGRSSPRKELSDSLLHDCLPREKIAKVRLSYRDVDANLSILFFFLLGTKKRPGRRTDHLSLGRLALPRSCHQRRLHLSLLPSFYQARAPTQLSLLPSPPSHFEDIHPLFLQAQDLVVSLPKSLAPSASF